VSGKSGRGDGDDASSFADAMRDVKPLAGRGKTQPPAPPRRARAGEASGPSEFELLHDGERLEGRAPGIDRKHLRRLRAGQVRVGSRVDLHGLEAREARLAVRASLLAAIEAGERCVLVIHGRGHHSPGRPVLKRSLPTWLAEAPLGPRILAFASATPEDGGTGATYVLLRRPSRESR